MMLKRNISLHNVTISMTSSKVLLSDICVSGGVVNAYKALQLAAKVEVIAKK